MRTVYKISSRIAALILFLMMAITFVDVIGRQVFNKPLRGATELTEITLMLAVFIMLPLVSVRRAHIRVDLFEGLFTKFLFLLQGTLTGLLGGTLFGLLSYRLFELGQRATRYGEITPGLEVPVGILLFVMCGFSALTAVAFFVAIFIKPKSADGAVEAYE